MAGVSLPFIIQDSLNRFEAYLSSASVIFGRSGDRQRGMRSDRLGNIVKLVGAMLHGCCIQHDGVVCHITRFWARPMTIAELARLAGMTAITAARCMADLVDLELVESRQVKRKNQETGQLEVSVGLRCFTPKFWEALGLLEKFKAAVEWAKKNARRKFILPFKGISLKAKEAAEHVGTVANKVLRDMKDAAEEAASEATNTALEWIAKIRERLRE